MSNEPSESEQVDTTENKQSKRLFTELDASNAENDNGLTEIDSVCMNCYKTGKTKLMLTRIPFYRDVIISSFSCENCNYKNNSVQSANRTQEKGVRIKLLVKNQADLNRELVKSDNATFKIPSIDFEIQPQKGALTTVEGVLDQVITNLESDIVLKKDTEPDLVEKLKAFLEKFNELKSLKNPFEVILDDPSGDSFIENPNAPNKDPQLTLSYYKRTKEMDELLGLNEENEITNEPTAESTETDLRDEVVQFKGNCSNCNSICETNMKLTDIPYFKTVIIMCTICETCGVKSSEVKPGTSVEEKGIRFTLKVTDQSDLNRDLIKSDYATFEIPEIEFYMNSGTLGGKFTTIEGLLKDSREQLDAISPFSAGGDSDSKDKSVKMKECLDKMELIQNGKLLNVTIILDDPSGNSYLQNIYAPDKDPNMEVEHYERDYDQNELLGLNDINTENYMNSNDDEAK